MSIIASHVVSSYTQDIKQKLEITKPIDQKIFVEFINHEGFEGFDPKKPEQAIHFYQESIRKMTSADFCQLAKNYLKLAVWLLYTNSHLNMIQKSLNLCLCAVEKIESQNLITETLLNTLSLTAPILAKVNESYMVSIIYKLLELYSIQPTIHNHNKIRKIALAPAATTAQTTSRAQHVVKETLEIVAIRQHIQLQTVFLHYLAVKKDNDGINECINNLSLVLDSQKRNNLIIIQENVVVFVKILFWYIESLYERSYDYNARLAALFLKSYQLYQKILELRFGINSTFPDNLSVSKGEAEILLILAEQGTLIAFEYGREMAKRIPFGKPDKPDYHAIVSLEYLYPNEVLAVTPGHYHYYPDSRRANKPDYYIKREDLEPQLVHARDALRQLFFLAAKTQSQRIFPLRIYQLSDWVPFLLSTNVRTSIHEELLSYKNNNLPLENQIMLKLTHVKTFYCTKYLTWVHHREDWEERQLTSLVDIKQRTFSCITEAISLLTSLKVHKDSSAHQWIAKQIFELSYLFYLRQDSKTEFLASSLQLQKILKEKFNIQNPFFLAKQLCLQLTSSQALGKNIEYSDLQTLVNILNYIIHQAKMPSSEIAFEFIEMINLLLAIILQKDKFLSNPEAIIKTTSFGLYNAVLTVAHKFQGFHGENTIGNLLHFTYLTIQRASISKELIDQLLSLLEKNMSQKYPKETMGVLIKTFDNGLGTAKILMSREQFPEALQLCRFSEHCLFWMDKLISSSFDSTSLQESYFVVRLLIAEIAIELSPPNFGKCNENLSWIHGSKYYNHHIRKNKPKMDKLFEKIQLKFYSHNDNMDYLFFEFQHFCLKCNSIKRHVILETIHDKTSSLKLGAESDSSRILSRKIVSVLLKIIDLSSLGSLKDASTCVLIEIIINDIKKFIYPSDILLQLEVELVFAQYLMRNNRFSDAKEIALKIISRLSDQSGDLQKEQAEKLSSELLNFVYIFSWNVIEENRSHPNYPTEEPSCREIRLTLRDKAIKLSQDPQTIFLAKAFQLSDYFIKPQDLNQIAKILAEFQSVDNNDYSTTDPMLKFDYKHIPFSFLRGLEIQISVRQVIRANDITKHETDTIVQRIIKILYEKIILDDALHHTMIFMKLSAYLSLDNKKALIGLPLNEEFCENEKLSYFAQTLWAYQRCGYNILQYLLSLLRHHSVDKKIIRALLGGSLASDNSMVEYIMPKFLKLFLFDNLEFLFNTEQIEIDQIVPIPSISLAMEIAGNLKNEMAVLLDNLEPYFFPNLELLFDVSSIILQYCAEEFKDFGEQNLIAKFHSKMYHSLQNVFAHIREQYVKEVPTHNSLVKPSPKERQHRAFAGRLLFFSEAWGGTAAASPVTLSSAPDASQASGSDLQPGTAANSSSSANNISRGTKRKITN